MGVARKVISESVVPAFIRFFAGRLPVREFPIQLDNDFGVLRGNVVAFRWVSDQVVQFGSFLRRCIGIRFVIFLFCAGHDKLELFGVSRGVAGGLKTNWPVAFFHRVLNQWF